METGFLINIFWRDGQCIAAINDQEITLHPWVGKQMEAWIKKPKVWEHTEIDRSLNRWLKAQGESRSMNPNKGPNKAVHGRDY